MLNKYKTLIISFYTLFCLVHPHIYQKAVKNGAHDQAGLNLFLSLKVGSKVKA